jgi:hypothetical protein
MDKKYKIGLLVIVIFLLIIFYHKQYINTNKKNNNIIDNNKVNKVTNEISFTKEFCKNQYELDKQNIINGYNNCVKSGKDEPEWCKQYYDKLSIQANDSYKNCLARFQ